jgi:hypothetical protein
MYDCLVGASTIQKKETSPAQQLKQEFDKDEDDVDLTDEAKWEDIHCIRCVQPRSVGLFFPRVGFWIHGIAVE